MKKIVFFLVLCAGMLTGFKSAAFAADQADQHAGHNTCLQEIMTEENCETDFCGEFYCSDCQKTYCAPVSYEDVGMPIMNLEGSLAGISKDNKVTVNISYSSESKSFSSSATLKVQGSSSANLPKKNYSVQFLKADGSKNKVKLVDDWGKQSKYCLKANYTDFSQSRNIVSGRIFNQIVHSRNIEDEINALPNGGVVDGYPVLVYLNGDLLGLYTMNIPKDKWMFGMDDDGRQALLFGDSNEESVKLFTEITDVNDVTSSGWDLEFCSTEDSGDTAWAAESMNEFIRFLLENDGESFKAGIDHYTDVDRAIDVLIYVFFMNGWDNSAKNMIWATYDGVRWIPSVYDMDGTWGMAWDGSITYAPDDFMPCGKNMLFQRLLDHYMDEITARYVSLREDLLSQRNVEAQFSAFFDQIPQLVYDADGEKWPEIPSKDKNNFLQIAAFLSERAAYMDEWFGVEIDNQTLEPVLSLNVPSAPIRIGRSAVFTAAVENMPEDAHVEWSVSGPCSYTVSEDTWILTVKGTRKGIINVSAKVVNADGSDASGEDAEATGTVEVYMLPTTVPFFTRVNAVNMKCKTALKSLVSLLNSRFQQ